jgi:hypothetical protein
MNNRTIYLVEPDYVVALLTVSDAIPIELIFTGDSCKP